MRNHALVRICRELEKNSKDLQRITHINNVYAPCFQNTTNNNVADRTLNAENDYHTDEPGVGRCSIGGLGGAGVELPQPIANVLDEKHTVRDLKYV